MKSAEEWIEETTGSPKCRLTTIGACSIKEIQLDAMKEGMKRAAEISRNNFVVGSPMGEAIATNFRKTIIKASEQLTIKDL